MVRPSTQPVPLSGVDIDPNLFPQLTPDSLLLPIGGGFNSRVYLASEYVIKISRLCDFPDVIERHVATMQSEDSKMAQFIGDHMPQTAYGPAASRLRPYKSRAVTVQPFVPGETLDEYDVETGHGADRLVGFLEACLYMFERTGKIPDLANVQTGFNIFRNSNVVMGTDEFGAITPYLTDTNFGKIQRSERLGPLWSRAIASGVRRGLRRLE